jgi:23S rRNA (uracil1939-C5)-methyltransferase
MDGVIVRDAFPGERVRVRIDARGRRASYATALERLEPHPARRTPLCPDHRDHDGGRDRNDEPGRQTGAAGRCDGCPLMAIDEPAQRAIKSARLRRLGLEVDRVVPSPRALGYRWSAKRGVAENESGLVFGSRRRRSDEIASMHNCLVDHPRIVAALEQLRAVANGARIRCFEADPRGGLRYVWAQTNGHEVMLTVLGGPKLRAAIAAISDQLDASNTLAVGVRVDPGNAIRGLAPDILRGEPLRWQTGDSQITLAPLGFLQPNPGVIDRAYDDLVRAADGAPLSGTRAWDLYAGAGAITRRLCAGFANVEGCEIDAVSRPTEATSGVIHSVDTVEFLAARADAMPPDLIVANPPRAGLREAAALIARSGCERVHLMSCNPESLVRDLASLSGYTIDGARAYDSLPQTAHIEVVVWLSRRNP